MNRTYMKIFIVNLYKSVSIGMKRISLKVTDIYNTERDLILVLQYFTFLNSVLQANFELSHIGFVVSCRHLLFNWEDNSKES